jgi:hypothetical protein
MLKIIKNKKGSIALLTVLLVSAVLIMTVVETASMQTTVSIQKSNTDQNKTLFHAADACLEDAMANLKQDSDYAGSNIILSGTLNCYSSVFGDGIKDVYIQVNEGAFFQAYQAQVLIVQNGDSNDLELLSWQRIN